MVSEKHHGENANRERMKMNMEDNETKAIMDRNCSIDILRLLFCFLIVNYHFFSYYLINIDFPNYFTRSYLGDEYFFIVSGFYLSKAAQKCEDSPFSWNVNQIIRRFKKVAIPYYLTWIVCFLGMRISHNIIGEVNKPIFQDVANSIYELLFLEMFGFNKGLYCNAVGWFFSALLIVLFLIGPWVAKYKKGFSMYFAPIIVFFSYGVLSLNFDWLYNPNKLIGNSFIMKGTLRALAGVCMGVFLHGVIQSGRFYSFKKSLSDKAKMGISVIDAILWFVIVAYMIYPFASRSADTEIQYDYIVVFLMAIALVPVLGKIKNSVYSARYKLITSKIGEFAFYAYFGQAIFYSFDKAAYLYQASVLIKSIVLNCAVVIFSIVLMFLSKGIKNSFKKAIGCQ